MTHSQPVAPLLENYTAVAAALPGTLNPRIATMRAVAASTYRVQGLPHAKVEAWKYTRLKDLETVGFRRADAGAVLPREIAGAGVEGPVLRIVLVDGRFIAPLSNVFDIPGVSLRSLRVCLDAGDDAVIQALDRDVDFSGAPMAALATAYLDDGAVLRVDAGVAVAPVVEVVAVSTAATQPRIAFPRLLVTVGAGAALTLVETFRGPADDVYAVNAVTDISLGENASLSHYVLQAQGAAATHVSVGRCDMAAGVHYEGFALQLGGKTARHEMRLRMLGVGGCARLNGAYGVRDAAVCDTTTVIEHIAPETTTDQVFKGILDDHGRGIFQGKVHVFRDAQRIVGNQLHKGLLLSRNAEVDCKPELLIYANDVKCSHGATVGEMDPDQLFFLRSRGIDEATARALLMRAFLGEAFDTIQHPAVRVAFHARAETWLSRREGEKA